LFYKIREQEGRTGSAWGLGGPNSIKICDSKEGERNYIR
jgi:hypothetical protein